MESNFLGIKIGYGDSRRDVDMGLGKRELIDAGMAARKINLHSEAIRVQGRKKSLRTLEPDIDFPWGFTIDHQVGRDGIIFDGNTKTDLPLADSNQHPPEKADQDEKERLDWKVFQDPSRPSLLPLPFSKGEREVGKASL